MTVKPSYCIALAVAFLLPWVLGSLAWAQTVVGSVTEVSGDASVKRGTLRIAATQNMPIQQHDDLITGPDGHLGVTFTDNSKTTLSPQSELKVDEVTVGIGPARWSTVLTLVSGAVRSIVSSTLGRAFNYQVKTSNAIVAVRGTDFEVAFSQGKARHGFPDCGMYTDVKVYSGIVYVANVSNPNQPVEVSGGFRTTVPCLLEPLSVGPLGLAARPGTACPLTGIPPPICPICPPSH